MSIFKKKKSVNVENGTFISLEQHSSSIIDDSTTVTAATTMKELDQYDEPIIKFASNRISTSKYTLLTFIPKNLFEQFRRVANMYFLFLVALQLIPSVGGGVSPILVASPLFTIITMTAIKDAFEDWKRHTQDKTLNNSKATIISNWVNVNMPYGGSEQFKSLLVPSSSRTNKTKVSDIKWSDAHWQDVKVGDIIRLNNNDQVPADMIILSTSEPDGLCYSETKNLDGETNLKVRHCVSATSSIKSEQDCGTASFYVESEPPNVNLYTFNGVLHWIVKDGADIKTEPISINDVLLRGCVLRNTEWVIGLVLYTGTDTKIMLNSGDTPSKRSRIEIETNFHPRSSSEVFDYDGNDDVDSGPFLSGFVTFWTSMVLFQNIVPISLYITIELVKTMQAYFIYSDIEIYYEKLDYPCVPRTWNISDDLGQIEYIFSDKTGTLTQNVMKFRKCTINGIAYGLGETDATHEMSKLFYNKYISSDFSFIDPNLFRALKTKDQQSKAIQDFFSALALCHTVLVENPDEDNPYNIVYKAQSPDEAALVACAKDVGFVFTGRFENTLVIEVMGDCKHFELLNVLEFNSNRKRMSVIVRSPEGSIILLCKGADSVIYERLEKDCQLKLREDTLLDLQHFANEGLRTLCLAYRIIPDEEYAEWSLKYAEAAASIDNREEKIEQACELIEHSLVLMGGTAIEDKLQEGVPETIATLAKAGIKLWVLTGDKIETAINIGFACNLLQNDMTLIIINASDLPSTLAQLHETMLKFFGNDVDKINKHALIIDGETLKYALDDSVKQHLLDLGKRCQSVLCCRVSPLQKAKVVEMVKDGLKVMTLAIGDGANDVSMIQEANVGVGIAGEEGRQAVMSADFAIAQFKYLEKLLLVHGRWSYIRIAEMISCFFYKNIVWTIAMFWYQIWTGFTAQYLYDYTYIMLYNLIFTAFPVMFLGTFDQDVNAKVSLKYPQLYKRGILQKDFTKSKFWLYVLDAFYQSIICYFVSFGLLQFGQSHANGLSNDGLEDLGTLVAASVIATTNLYVGLNTFNWTWMAADRILYTEIDFWMSIALSVIISILPRFVVKYLHKTYWPIDTDIIREEVFKENNYKSKKYGIINDDDLSSLSQLQPPLESEVITVNNKQSSSSRNNSLRRKRTRDSSISIDQMVHMDSGICEAFTGFAFSVEESAFETFRKSVYSLPSPRRKTFSEEMGVNHEGLTTESHDWTLVKAIDLVHDQKIVVIDGDTSIEGACDILVKNNISSAPVYDRSTKSYVGMFDWADVMSYLLIVLKKKNSIEQQKKTDAELTKEFQDLLKLSTEHQPIPVKLASVVELFGNGTHRVAVLDGDGNLKGILSQSGVLNYLYNNVTRFPQIESLFPKTIYEFDIGKSPVIFAQADSFVLDALIMMNDNALSSVAIIDSEGMLIGNISMTDVKYIIRSYSHSLMWKTCQKFVSHVRSIQGLEDGQDRYPVFDVRTTSTLGYTIAKLTATKAHRVWVVDEKIKAVGVVSLTDILGVFAQAADGNLSLNKLSGSTSSS
nr:1340_t:CDS:10 [Entrophospora candida]